MSSTLQLTLDESVILPEVVLTKEFLVREYVDNLRGLQGIAKISHHAERMVRRRLIEFGIPIRTQGMARSIITHRITERKCKKCGIVLTDKNWLWWNIGRRFICTSCQRNQKKECYHRHMKDPEHGKSFREARRRAVRKYKQRHPEYKSTYNEYQRVYRWQLKKRIVDRLGGKCVACGITDIRILVINHKNGKGRIEFQELGGKRGNLGSGSIKLYYAIDRNKRKTDDLDIRCYNCNMLYEYEKGRRKPPVFDLSTLRSAHV